MRRAAGFWGVQRGAEASSGRAWWLQQKPSYNRAPVCPSWWARSCLADTLLAMPGGKGWPGLPERARGELTAASLGLLSPEESLLSPYRKPVLISVALVGLPTGPVWGSCGLWGTGSAGSELQAASGARAEGLRRLFWGDAAPGRAG